MRLREWATDIRFREGRYRRYTNLLSLPHIRETDAEMQEFANYYEVAFVEGRDYMRPWQKVVGFFVLLFVELATCLSIMAIMGTTSVVTWCAIVVAAIAIDIIATKNDGVADYLGCKIRDYRLYRMRKWLETAIWE